MRSTATLRSPLPHPHGRSISRGSSVCSATLARPGGSPSFDCRYFFEPLLPRLPPPLLPPDCLPDEPDEPPERLPPPLLLPPSPLLLLPVVPPLLPRLPLPLLLPLLPRLPPP